MRAIKVLFGVHHPSAANWDAQIPPLRSAIPTPYALGYWPGRKTVPEFGKLMVYLPSDVAGAEVFCPTAAGWYYHSDLGADGTIEIWSVECHNLYKMDYIIPPSDFGYWECREVFLKRFWEKIDVGADPREVVWAKMAKDPVWTTDWIIPLERLGVYDIEHRSWIRGCRRDWR